MVYFLFFCSGLSGLIYEVVWVREFGNIFGNTVYSASLVTAIFMLGLGAGGYGFGIWADRRYASRSGSLLRTYGLFEAAIALLGFGISLLLPYLAQLSAAASSYTRDATGWYGLSASSYLIRGLIAVVLLAPITLLMGGTLMLLIRHLVGRDFERERARIAVLYGVNTAGAALGALLTDFTLVPMAGYRGAQAAAVLLNIVAAAGALLLASRQVETSDADREPVPEPAAEPRRAGDRSRAVWFTTLALALSGFAAMGMEILWFRHFTLLLGGFRAVFSLLLTVVLIGTGAGALFGSLLIRRTTRPAEWLMATLGLFIVTTLFGLANADLVDIDAAVALANAQAGAPPGAFTELMLKLVPIAVEASLPAFLMGLSYPLGNAVIQRVENTVGRHAGELYLANTIGAAAGVLAGGFWMLPRLGMQRTATALMTISALAVVPLILASRADAPVARLKRFGRVALSGVALLAAGTLVLWLILPSGYLIARATAFAGTNVKVLSQDEAVDQVVTVTDVPGEGKRLMTDGHPMSATNRMSQRYMRALAHVPLLMLDRPESVLVIGFGVGNTTHAAALHSSIRRIDVAELSRAVLSHAKDFEDTNKNVLADTRVGVYVNDGRQHLRMQPPASYDLITLEPPPLALSGVGALYSREFYALASSRLKPNGYLSQWLPAYQVSFDTLQAMVRAFVDVFPQAVLLAGTDEELLLIGVKGGRIEVDPDKVEAALTREPAVRADLARFDLGTTREIIGSFVASGEALAAASRTVAAVTDDRPLQEYGGSSRLTWTRVNGVPAPLVRVDQLDAWCPRCFAGGKPVPVVAGIDRYTALLKPLYEQTVPSADGPGSVTDPQTAGLIDSSAFLREALTAQTVRRNAHGVELAAAGKIDEAMAEFKNALLLNPKSARTHWNLGRALEASGATQEAVSHFRRSVELEPNDGPARYDLASTLVDLHEYAEAVEHFRAAIRLMPTSAEAHNNLGIALGSQGKLEEAIAEFQEALKLQPAHAAAQRNLTMALEAAGSGVTGR